MTWSEQYVIHVTDETRNYAIWTDIYGKIHYLPYNYTNYYAIERAVWSPMWARYFFNDFWHYSLWISLAYVLGIFGLQRWMALRKPFKLKRPLIVWNAALAIFSAVGFWRLSEEFAFVVSNHTFTDSVCRTVDVGGPATLWSFLFAISKAFELIDTVFLVLRKRPLIFLHWYHHAVVLIYCWHAARDLTAASRWFIYMNYGVHALMYTYYALSSAGVRPSRAVSMCVTFLQTAQMLVGVGISIYIAVLKRRHHVKLETLKADLEDTTMYMNEEGTFVCQQTDESLALCFFIYLSFAVLFINFLRAAYFSSNSSKPSAAKRRQVADAKANVDSMCSVDANAKFLVESGENDGTAAAKSKLD